MCGRLKRGKTLFLSLPDSFLRRNIFKKYFIEITGKEKNEKKENERKNEKMRVNKRNNDDKLKITKEIRLVYLWKSI